MNVLLIQDVPGLGKVGDVKKVADGYARNYLIPRGLAKIATPGELKQVEQHKRTAAKQTLHELKDAQAIAERLGQMTLVFQARAGEGTKLYGSITSADIAERISEELGRSFDRRKIHLDESLRQLGTHQVPVRLMSDLVPEVTIVIEREGEPEAE
ncbi:MAG: 50S ribosomal protein L9 [Anaerolineae bacterium]|nr:50S ribosomal protein L9 [Anaerolineae bacterium]